MELNKEHHRQFASALKQVSGYDFTDYTEKSFLRRLQKILDNNQFSFNQLLSKVVSNEAFREETVREITVNTTELFRDPKMWNELRPIMQQRFQDSEHINIWHAGASSGQEIYSMLIFLDQLGLLHKARIYATDINTKMLKQAASGTYKYRNFDEFLINYNAVFPDAPHSFKQYFDIDILRFEIRVKQQMLNRVYWAKHDLVTQKHPFGTTFDLIMCRNVLIYFSYELQNKVFNFFHHSLKLSGMLVIGVHEGIIGEVAERFNKTGYIYYKR